MGNAQSIWACLEVYTRLKVVQVLRPDGRYEEFADPIEVSMVMRMYPDHLVVLCSSLDRPVGALSKIRIMRPDQELAVGQSYLLHPIPPQYRKTMFRAHNNMVPLITKGGTTSKLGMRPESPGFRQRLEIRNIEKPTKLKKLSAKKAKRLADLRGLCANLLQPLQPVSSVGSSISSSINNICDSTRAYNSNSTRRSTSLLALSRSIAEAPTAPLLDSRVVVSSIDASDEKPRTSFGFNEWRPALDSIPESPGRSFGSDLQSRHMKRYQLLVDR